MNTMKKYSLIVFLLLSQFPGAVFALEECPGSQGNYRNWTNCKGTFTRANGDQYEGEWKYSKADGLGTKTWANGDQYVGGWKDDNLHGQGTFTYANGDQYEGEWKNGKAVWTRRLFN